MLILAPPGRIICDIMPNIQLFYKKFYFLSSFNDKYDDFMLLVAGVGPPHIHYFPIYLFSQFTQFNANRSPNPI